MFVQSQYTKTEVSVGIEILYVLYYNITVTKKFAGFIFTCFVFVLFWIRIKQNSFVYIGSGCFYLYGPPQRSLVNLSYLEKNSPGLVLRR